MAYRIVTIDGPAGAGKTTISRHLAKRLGWVYVDTGALYRGVAYEIDRRKIPWQDDEALKAFLSDLDLDFVLEKNDLKLLSSGKDITAMIRTPEISMLASKSSAKPLVRKALLGIQRHIATCRDAVFEGRDMGTVVFPDADFKFFLSADLNIRAKRRFDELGKDGVDMETVLEQMRTRDNQDASRSESPLKPAPDAVKIDSSRMSVDQVVDEMLSHIQGA